MATEHFLKGTMPLEGGELAITIEYRFTPGTPFRMYKRNGDPADPPDPPEVEFVSVTTDRKLTDIQNEAMVAWAENYFETDEGFTAAVEHAEDSYERR